MIQKDIQDEAGALTLYKKIIELATKEGDVTTAFMFQGILEQEEGHHAQHHRQGPGVQLARALAVAEDDDQRVWRFCRCTIRTLRSSFGAKNKKE